MPERDQRGSGTLVLLRHGESTANASGTFTGLNDVDLSPRGVEQAHAAAALLVAEGLRPDEVFTSEMLRARRTAELVLADLDDVAAPVVATWRLDERDYGVLTGMSKSIVKERYGAESFHAWRRTLHGKPPPMPLEERSAVGFVAHGQAAQTDHSGTGPVAPGDGESLAEVVARVRPLWDGPLRGRLVAGETVLVVAHGNSLRALSALVDGLSDEELEELNLPTAQPIVYDIGADGGPRPKGGRYLDPDRALLAAIRIAFEGGT